MIIPTEYEAVSPGSSDSGLQVMLLLQRSVWHTHLMRRPLKRVCGLQVASGQDFSTISQAATAKISNNRQLTIISLKENQNLKVVKDVAGIYSHI